MNLSLLNDNSLLSRYEELTNEYTEYAVELEKYLKKFHDIRVELALLEDEVNKRKLNEKKELDV